MSVHSTGAGLEFSVSHHGLSIDSSHIVSDLLILKPCISPATDFISDVFSDLFYSLRL